MDKPLHLILVGFTVVVAAKIVKGLVAGVLGVTL